MAIVPAMSESRKSENKPTMVYIHAKVKRRLQRALFDLEGVDYGGRRPDQSNVTSALWLWFASLSPAEAEAFLAREYPKLLEATEQESAQPGPDPATPTKVIHRGKRKPTK